MRESNPTKFSQLWSKDIAAFGYVSLPLPIFYFKKELGITSSEIEVLCYIIAHRWTREEDPYPSLKQIAIRTGKSSSAIRSNVRSLVRKGCVKRRYRVGATSLYSFEPLTAKLTAMIKNSQRSSYFQKGEYAKTDMPPYQKTDTKVDNKYVDYSKSGIKIENNKRTEEKIPEAQSTLPGEGLREYTLRAGDQKVKDLLNRKEGTFD